MKDEVSGDKSSPYAYSQNVNYVEFFSIPTDIYISNVDGLLVYRLL